MFKTHKITSSFYYMYSPDTIYTGSNLLWTSASNYSVNNFKYYVNDELFDETNKYYVKFWIRKYDDYSGSFDVLFTSSLGEFSTSRTITSGDDFTMSYSYTVEKPWFATGSISGSMVTHSIYDPNYNFLIFDITDMYSSSISKGFATHSCYFYATSSNPDVSYSLYSNETLSRYYPVIIEKYDIRNTSSLETINEYTASAYVSYSLDFTNNIRYFNSQSYNLSMSCYPMYYQQSFDDWSIFDNRGWTFRHPELYYRIKEYYPDYQTILLDFDEDYQWVKWDSSSNYIPIDFDSLEEGYYSIDLYDKDNNKYYYNTTILRIDK